MSDLEVSAPPPSTSLTRVGSNWWLVLSLALPALAQQYLVLSVTWSDRLLAGRFATMQNPEQAAYIQAAQTTANYLAWFVSNYIILVSVGSTALVARFIGAGDRRGAIQVLHQALMLGLALGVLVTGLSNLFLEEMVGLLQLKGPAAEYAVHYLRPIFLALAFQVVEQAGIACLIGAGDTRTGFWVLLGVALFNLPLAWGLCLGIGPLPELGFVGIAVGTALSHVFGCVAVLVILIRGRLGLHLSWRYLRPNLSLQHRLLRISVPAGVDSLSVVVGQFWFLSLVNQLGDVASSAHGVALSWEALGFQAGAAFGIAAMALVGQNLGAGQPRQAARSGWTAFALGCGLMCFMGLLFLLLAPEMFAIFCPYPEQEPIVKAGIPVLRLVAFAMPPLASAIVFTYALRGAGDTRVPVLFTWFGFLVVRIPLTYFLAFHDFEVPLLGSIGGLFGAWLAMAADLLVRGVFFFLRFASGAWQRIRV